MKIANQEGDTSLIAGDCGKTPNGIFPEIREILKGLAAGRVYTPLSEKTKEKISASVCRAWERKKRGRLYWKKYYQKNRKKILAYHKKFYENNRGGYNAYYRKKRLDQIDAIFEMFGYSVEVLERMEVASS